MVADQDTMKGRLEADKTSLEETLQSRLEELTQLKAVGYLATIKKKVAGPDVHLCRFTERERVAEEPE